MNDKERKARHIFPKFDDINTYTVRIFDQLRKVKRIGNNDIRGLNPGTLIFTDCTHPMQNVICPEEKITAWRVDMPNVELTGSRAGSSPVSPESEANGVERRVGGVHHIWCNYSSAGHPSECKQCKRLYDLYPMEGTTADELAAQYFPDAVKRETPNVI